MSEFKFSWEEEKPKPRKPRKARKPRSRNYYALDRALIRRLGKKLEAKRGQG